MPETGGQCLQSPSLRLSEVNQECIFAYKVKPWDDHPLSVKKEMTPEILQAFV